MATATMVRADKHNALDRAMFEALHAAIDRLKAEPGVRAVVLRGDGPSFCSGLRGPGPALAPRLPEVDIRRIGWRLIPLVGDGPAARAGLRQRRDLLRAGPLSLGTPDPCHALGGHHHRRRSRQPGARPDRDRPRDADGHQRRRPRQATPSTSSVPAKGDHPRRRHHHARGARVNEPSAPSPTSRSSSAPGSSAQDLRAERRDRAVRSRRREPRSSGKLHRHQRVRQARR